MPRVNLEDKRSIMSQLKYLGTKMNERIAIFQVKIAGMFLMEQE